MKKTAITLLFLWMLCVIGSAQRSVHSDTVYRVQKLEKVGNKYKDISPREGKWNLGGAIGMTFADQTTINVSPQVSYSQSVYFTLGGGISYSYFYSGQKNHKYNMNYVGLDVFGRLTPFRYLAFQIQPEIQQYWGKHNGKEVTANLLATLLLGGGFNFPMGRGGISLMFYYDVIQNKYTPYGSNLFYSVGYSFNL